MSDKGDKGGKGDKGDEDVKGNKGNEEANACCEEEGGGASVGP